MYGFKKYQGGKTVTKLAQICDGHKFQKFSECAIKCGHSVGKVKFELPGIAKYMVCLLKLSKGALARE